jgi:hypothetical protein
MVGEYARDPEADVSRLYEPPPEPDPEADVFRLYEPPP